MSILRYLKAHIPQTILALCIVSYIIYFSVFTFLRYHNFGASYYDLGIMQQTVYNTFQSIQNTDLSRVLELTNPENSHQIKRMAIHNDPILALIAPLYFVHSGPLTLLVVQTVVLAFGAIAVFLIGNKIFKTVPYTKYVSLIFSLAYLMYTPMQRANIFDFHGVTLATSFLLWMVYFWLSNRLKISFLFLILSLLCKEQIGLTTFLFGLYALYEGYKNRLKNPRFYIYPAIVMAVSLGWFALSIFAIIPYFRGGNHFALGYYGDFGESPTKVMLGIFKHPESLGKYLFRSDTPAYFYYLLAPLGFLSVLSPIQLLISAPEFAINLLSSSWNMRNIIFHYTSVIQPFSFISSMYGAVVLFGLLRKKNVAKKYISFGIMGLIIATTIGLAATKGPLPFSVESNMYPVNHQEPGVKQAQYWANQLKDDMIPVAVSGQVAPYFASRKYLYQLNDAYINADYVVFRVNDVYNSAESGQSIRALDKLNTDPHFELIFNQDSFFVFQRKNS